MRKVFLDNLPKKIRAGKEIIDWQESTGCKVPFVYDDIEGEIEVIEYIKKSRISVAYNNRVSKISGSDLAKCKIKTIIGKKTGEFKIPIGRHFCDDKRDITIIDRATIIDESGIKRKKYKYRCNKCGFDCGEYYRKGIHVEELWVDESAILSKNGGCTCCRPYPQIVVEGINDIPTTNPELVKYFQEGYDEAKRYTFRSNQEIYPICPDCGIVKTKPIKIDKIYECQGINCTCGDGFSFGHKYLFSMLRQLDVNFSDNVRFDWCKYKMKNKIKQGEYDFVIEDKKLIIEVDGYFHRNDNQMNGQEKEESQFIDSEKDRLAKEHGYNIVRVLYDHKNRESLKDVILSAELCEYFDLSRIDWSKCLEYGLCNISKMVADYWNNKEEWETTTDLIKYFGLSRKTISVYLKMWSNLGYCNYDSELESKKKYEKAKQLNVERCSKAVEVLKDGVLLKTFNSLSEISRSSQDVLGVSLQHANALKVIQGKRKHHKGFTFRYVDDNRNNAN